MAAEKVSPDVVLVKHERPLSQDEQVAASNTVQIRRAEDL